MTKAELITEIAIKTGYDKKTIGHILESAMSNIKKTVANGENVYRRGFGTFSTKTRAAKVARNILANTTVEVPEHKIPSFKASNEFAQTVR